MSIKDRMTKINEIVKTFVPVFNRNNKSISRVTSTGGNAYQVSRTWETVGGIPTARCEVFSHNTNSPHRPSNLGKVITAPVLAVIKASAAEAGKLVKFCETKADADRVSRFGGQVFRITNQGRGSVWGVCS